MSKRHRAAKCIVTLLLFAVLAAGLLTGCAFQRDRKNTCTTVDYLDTVCTLTAYEDSERFVAASYIFLSELEHYEPVVYEAFSLLKDAHQPELETINGVRCMENWNGLDEVYDKSPKVSIDNGIAEKTHKACAVKASFAWKDIGTWDTFGSLFTNKLDKTADIQSENCFVYSDIPVALCGVSDLIVVVKNNRVLVMKKGCSSLAKTAAQLIDGE